MSATGSVRYLGKKPSSAEVKERYYNVGVDVPATSSPITNLVLSDNYGLSYVEVTLNGVKLDAQDYTATTGNSLDFAVGVDLVAGDILGVKSYDFATTPRVNPIIQQRQEVGVTTTSQQQLYDMAFTSTLDEVLIYKNGVLLDPSEYTADTSANSISLTNPPTNGDKLTFLVYGATKVVGSAEAVTQTYIDNAIAGQTTTIQSDIALKADSTYVTSEVTRVDGDITVLQGNKADVTYVDSAVAGKATTSYVDNAIATVSITSTEATHDILSPQTTTTSISSTHFDNDNVVWFANDGSLVSKTSEKNGSASARNDGESNNYLNATKTAGQLYIDCKFALMDLNEVKDGSGFNTTDIETARASLDASERWSSTIAPSATTNGLNCTINESHELMPFHVSTASGGTGDGTLGIVPHLPYVNDQDIIYITGIPFGKALPPTLDSNNWTTNQYLDIYDWRTDPMKVKLHYHSDDVSSTHGGKKFKLEYISGINGLDLSELTSSPDSLYLFRYYKDGWSDPSGYFVSASDNGSGPASVSLATQSSKRNAPVRLVDYKICNLDVALRPSQDIEVVIDSIVRKSDYQTGMTETLTTLEGLGNEWRINKGDGTLYTPHTLGSSLDDSITNGTWFGSWDAKKTDTKLLSDLCYGYNDPFSTSPYRKGRVNQDLSGVGSHDVGEGGNWEYKTSAMGSLAGTAYQSGRFYEGADTYKYFNPNSFLSNTPYGFDAKWYAFTPSSVDQVVATTLKIKANGDVLISGVVQEGDFHLGYGPHFYKSKRTSFFGASFKTTLTLPA